MALLKLKKTGTTQEQKVKKVTAKKATYDFINAAKEFETSRNGDIERSRLIAWRVAAASMACFVMSVVAIMLMTPLKERFPYVVRIDNNTGATDIVNTLSDAKSNYGDEVSKFFAAQYVRLVEGYDWYTLQSQVNQAMMFSDANMQSQLQKKYAMPTAPHKIYKNNQRVNVKINNVSIIDPKGILQVRFTTTVEPMNGGTYSVQTNTITPEPQVTNHIATIGYDYVNVPTLDDVRLVNPLGFTVKTYRVDDDASIQKPTVPTTQAPITTPAQSGAM